MFKAELDHKDLVDTIQFSPDGKFIAGEAGTTSCGCGAA